MIRRVFLAASALTFALGTSALADSFTDPLTKTGAISGTMEIDFGSRKDRDTTGKVPEGSPALGAKDIYKVNLDVFGTTFMQGEIVRQPWLPTAKLGTTAQNGYIAYDLNLGLRSEKDPTKTKVLGKWAGGMSLDGNGLYSLDTPPEGKGAMRIAIDPFQNIDGFTSEFGGQIQGRVPAQAGLWGLADRTAKKVSKTYSRVVDGKMVQVSVSGADPMEFIGVTMGQGPLAGFPEARLVGSANYDSETGNWYLDTTTTYSVGGVQMRDVYSGTIRWNEDPNRESNGLGYYDINVRLNEQPATEAEVFAAGDISIEDAFFAIDTKVPGFTGKISYVDTFEDDSVVSSKVTYNIDAASASKVQAVNFAKTILLMIGPFNDE